MPNLITQTLRCLRLLSVTVILLFAAPTSAHPGNTASDGCHYCYTNCSAWGVIEGTRHCHYQSISSFPALSCYEIEGFFTATDLVTELSGTLSSQNAQLEQVMTQVRTNAGSEASESSIYSSAYSTLRSGTLRQDIVSTLYSLQAAVSNLHLATGEQCSMNCSGTVNAGLRTAAIDLARVNEEIAKYNTVINNVEEDVRDDLGANASESFILGVTASRYDILSWWGDKLDIEQDIALSKLLFVERYCNASLAPPPEPPGPTSLADRLRGKILLQVEQHGEAWYVHPDSAKRFYMKDGPTAYQMMRNFGLGITDVDLEAIPMASSPDEMNSLGSACSSNPLANRLKGRILLQVQQHGEAWYVDTEKCTRIYMKDGSAAYSIMRYLSLGISDADLGVIEVGSEGELSN